MNLMTAFETRESCRAYSDAPVEKEQLKRLLQAATLAPSAGNGQPWRYQVVTNPVLLGHLAPLTQGGGFNAFVNQAPCVIAVWEQVQPRMLERYGERYQGWVPVDIGLSVGHLCLAAAQEGLGTCILGVFDEDKVKQLLNIPEQSTLRLLVTVGHPQETAPPRPKKRLPVEKVAAFLA